MAQDSFAAHHIEKACAAIVDNSRYNKAYTNAISFLANVATDFMRKIATKANALTEISGKEETTVEHVLMADEAYGIRTSDLIQYIKSNKSFSTKALPLFPVLPPSSISRSTLPQDVLDCLCKSFCSCFIGKNNLFAAGNAVPLVKVATAKLPPQRKNIINPIIRPMKCASINETPDLFDLLHNDSSPIDFDSWEQSAAELKLLMMPPVRYETTDDMANAVKPPSYWEKRAQTAKYEQNYNWADQECSSDSEISLIDSVVLSPRPLDDPNPPIKLRDAIESSYACPSQSIIRKANKNNNKISKNNNRPIATAARRKPYENPKRKPVTRSNSEAATTVSSMDLFRPSIKMVLRRAPLLALTPTVSSSDYEIVFCSTKSGQENEILN